MSLTTRFCALLALGLLGFAQATAAQTAAPLPTKIKVYLVGTFHFDPSTSDVRKTSRVDMSTPEKQRQLEELTDILRQTHADKVFIEWKQAQQRFADSTYALYRKGHFMLGNSERYQLGYRLAKKLNLARVHCVAAEGTFDYEAARAYAQQHNQLAILKGVHDKPPVGDSTGLLIESRLAAIKQTQAPATTYAGRGLLSVFQLLNSPAIDQENMDSYLLGFTRVGNGAAYPGADLAGDFFKTNVRIYTNLLRAIDVQHDKAVVLIIGQGHTAFLKSILRYNPLFEVAEVLPLLEAK
ncbi:hypothetical protein HHL22_12510 [Hymenobacter sp. RP-2-7]|uniref:TraB/GumN family protein n=1 Tax=Hymenobacter polaris TaxID=2682546 RepID=A0A7Y0FMM2_9BACT|nr:DUF5694 domain-containing protein [Hymenobacter polaris]NML66027.1 hypothetical protein [Hymenobacter polaris]